jgi:hypothetical protein
MAGLQESSSCRVCLTNNDSIVSLRYIYIFIIIIHRKLDCCFLVHCLVVALKALVKSVTHKCNFYD